MGKASIFFPKESAQPWIIPSLLPKCWFCPNYTLSQHWSYFMRTQDYVMWPLHSIYFICFRWLFSHFQCQIHSQNMTIFHQKYSHRMRETAFNFSEVFLNFWFIFLRQVLTVDLRETSDSPSMCLITPVGWLQSHNFMLLSNSLEQSWGEKNA